MCWWLQKRFKSYKLKILSFIISYLKKLHNNVRTTALRWKQEFCLNLFTYKMCRWMFWKRICSKLKLERKMKLFVIKIHHKLSSTTHAVYIVQESCLQKMQLRMHAPIGTYSNLIWTRLSSWGGWLSTFDLSWYKLLKSNCN